MSFLVFSSYSLAFSVIESRESLCMTLILKNAISKSCPEDTADKMEEDTTRTMVTASFPLTWKVRWFSEESLFNFVALLRTLHASATSSPLVVRCMP